MNRGSFTILARLLHLTSSINVRPYGVCECSFMSKGSTMAALLKQEQLLRMPQEIPLSDAELAALDRCVSALDRC